MKIPSGSLISFMANKVKLEGGINLAQGIPAYQPPKELLKKLKSIVDDSIHQYAPGTGNPNLKKLIIDYYREYNIGNNNLLIVNGATEAISLIYTYLNKQINAKFSALAFDPVYESYKYLPQIFNNNFKSIPFSKDNRIDFVALEKIIVENSVKILFLASPGNPLGKACTKEETETLIMLIKKYKVYLIFDAVYTDLYFNEKPYEPLNEISEFVFYVNAFSKKLSITGWRLGYLICDKIHYQNLLDVHDYIGLSSPSLLQQAVYEYLDENNFGEIYCNNLRKTLRDNYKLLANALKNIGFEIFDAQGGYFVWCKLPTGHADGLEFAIRLYDQEKVACVPGIHFSENGKNLVRFNIAQEPRVLDEAIEKIKSFLK